MRDGFGVALGSGGARGWCHIGVLDALSDRGLEPAGVAGCSMGALVGAAWASGKLPELKDWALGLSRAKMLRHLDLGTGPGGLVGGSAVRRLLDRLDVPERIEDLDKPLAIVAADMATGREIWFTEGNLRDAVRASVAIPGVFRPHHVGGRWLLDGCLVNPVPVSTVRALGLARILAVNPSATGGAPHWEPKDGAGLWDQLSWASPREQIPEDLRTLLPGREEPPVPSPGQGPDYYQVVSVSIEILAAYLLATRSAADPPDVKMDADLRHMSVLELYRAEEAIAEGRRMVEAAGDALDLFR